MAGSPNTTAAPAPADRRDERDADERDDDGADVPAGDVGADGEPATLGRELLGQQTVADRVLRRPADPRRDVRDGVGHEARRERGEREAAAEQDPAESEQPAPGHDPGQAGVAQLDRAGQERPDGGQEGDGVDADPELVDDLEEDERQDDGLGVVDGMRHRQQAERPHRVDGDGRHGRMVPQIGLAGWAKTQGQTGWPSGPRDRLRAWPTGRGEARRHG